MPSATNSTPRRYPTVPPPSDDRLDEKRDPEHDREEPEHEDGAAIETGHAARSRGVATITRHGAWRSTKSTESPKICAPAALQLHAPRAGHDDDLGARGRIASSTIARPMLRVRAMRPMTRTPYESPIARASSSCSFASRDVLRQLGVERQVERHLDRSERDDRRAPFRGEPASEVHRLVGGVAGRDRHEDAAELERGGERRTRPARARSPPAARAGSAAGRRRRRRSRTRASRARRSGCSGTGSRRRATRAPSRGRRSPRRAASRRRASGSSVARATGCPRPPAAAAAGSPRRARS